MEERTMKKIIRFATLLACFSVLLMSCQMELNTDEPAPIRRIQIVSEGFESDVPTKTIVSGTDVAWIGDGTEMVAINSETFDKAVTIEGEKAYINASPEFPVFGYYGLLQVKWPATKTTPEISIPSAYNCSYDNDGRQVIALPMVAYSTSGSDKLQFYHVTAAVKVVLKNGTGSDIKLSHVVVSSAEYGLANSEKSYYHTITLNEGNAPTVPFNTIDSHYSNKVAVDFGGKDYPSIANNATLEVQVPILPIPESNLTIDVYAFKESNTATPTVPGVLNGPKYYTTYHFSATNLAPELARNQMMTANILLDPNHTTQNTSMTENVDGRGITVNDSGKNVLFSKGNLKYSNGTWLFHDKQYEKCFMDEDDAQNVVQHGYYNYDTKVDGTFDLFCWGTSGYDHGATLYQPYSGASSASMDQNANFYAYGSATKSLYNQKDSEPYMSGKADWGYNKISNGGNTENYGWRTPKWEEWKYMLQTREASCINGVLNARFTYVLLNGKQVGVVIFPDHYYGGTPEGVEWGDINSNVLVGDLNKTTKCTTAGWEALENAGCIFLPRTGWREYTTVIRYSGKVAAYWSSDPIDDANHYYARCFMLTANNYLDWSAGMKQERAIGIAVRLVKDL